MKPTKLAKWFAKAGRSHQSVADELGVTRTLVTMWSSGLQPVPPHWCPTIERITAGEVRCEDLQPDVEWSVLRRPRAA